MFTNSTRLASRGVLYAAATLLASSLAIAQLSTTGIRGLVRDPSGAVIPDVSIKLVDTSTNLEKGTASNADGSFIFGNLQSGTYTLTATTTGFQTAVYGSIVVDSGRTTDVSVEMKIGAATQSVEVSAVAVQLSVTSNEIGTTIANNSIQKLPLAGRETLNFALLIPGAQSANSDRNSTFNGLPNASLNITVDGMNNNSQRFKSGGTSFFQFAPSRLDAMEQVTVSTSGTGADAAGEGAMQIRMTTKRGTNQYHFKVFEQFHNEALNANSYFNTLRGIARPRNRQNNPGGSFSGPLVPFWAPLKNKLFFFAYFEAQPQPETIPTTNNILTAESRQGIYRYIGTDGVQRTVNLLQEMGARGYTSTIDPTVAGILDSIDATRSNASRFEPIAGAPFMERMLWNRGRDTNHIYPTARLDYQITPKVAWHGSWNLRHSDTGGRSTYPGTVYNYRDQSKITTYLATNSVDWTVSPTVLNNTLFGIQSNLEYFYVGSDIRQWAPYGHRRINFPNFQNTANYLEPMIWDQVPFDRNNPVYQLQDTLTWVKRKHTLTFGGLLKRTSFYEISYGNAGVLGYNIGLAAGDPVGADIRTALGTALNTANNDLANAQNLYALLTGRLSGISGSQNVNETTHQYERFGPLTQRFAETTLGLYAQDSFRITPHLTLNYGLRWNFDGAIHSTNGVNSLPSPGSFFGPSNGPFQPGVLNGNLNPGFVQANYPYGKDFLNPAPNFGFSWNPSASSGWLGKLLGGNKTVIGASYGISFYTEGMNAISNVLTGNRGATQNINATSGSSFEPGKLELRSPMPALKTYPASFTFPLPLSAYVLDGGANVNYVNPNLRSPYVQNWNFRIQREIVNGLVLEARYVGTKATKVWHYQNMQETNILENQFLPQFIQAQQNLAINRANGRGDSFQNFGLPGQAAIPIFETAFGANGTQPALAAGSGFTNSGFVQNLLQGAAGSLANSLANTNTNTYYCRLVGANFAPCAAQGFTAATPYPINFFRPNPFAGNNLNYQTSDVNTNYHGLQIQVRKAFSRGLTFDAGYTWSKALGGISNLDNQTAQDQWQTLRNGRLDYGPIPFDRRHSFYSYWTYELPVGRNRWINITNPVLDRVLGGWYLGGMEKIASGSPSQLTGGRNTFNQFADGGVAFGNGLTAEKLQKRLNTVVSDYIPSCQCFKSDVGDIIATNGAPNSSFYAPGQTPGVIGPSIYLYGKTTFKLDMSLSKDIRIRERLKFNFQANVFNVLNHPFLDRGTSGATSVNFGNVTSIIGSDTNFNNTSTRNVQLRGSLEW